MQRSHPFRVRPVLATCFLLVFGACAKVGSSSDTTPPSAGSGIAFASVDQTEMSVSWGMASDAETSSANLSYKVVMGTAASAIDTVEEVNAVSGANLLMDWTKATYSKQVSGLAFGVTYYFAVLVKDEAANLALYAPSGQATRDNSIWTHQAYLKSANNSNSDFFGNSVSISGDTVLVGANGEDSDTTAIINGADLSSTNNAGNNNGAAYVFIRSGNNWSPQAYLKAPNTSSVDQFGYSVALSADTALIGSPGETSNTTAIINGTDLSSTNDLGAGNGAAYVFRRSGTAWSHEAYLKAPNNSNNDFFGYVVALSQDTAVVGAHGEASNTTGIINGTDLSSTNNSGSLNGAAYVFKRTGTNWSHEAYLKAPNNSDGDYFGYALGIDGDTIVVGAYREASTTTAIINGSNLAATNNSGSLNGAAYVYSRVGSTWSHQAYLKAPNNSSGANFGISVGVSGDTVVVGANGEASTTTTIVNGADLSSTNNGGSANGAAYVFARSANQWSHQAYLKAPNNSNNEGFGQTVAVAGDRIVAGARYEPSTTTSIINGTDLSSTNTGGGFNGAAYVFSRSGTSWHHQAYLKPPKTSVVDQFGAAVAIWGSTVAVGAFHEGGTTSSIINGADLAAANNSGTDNGAVFVFKVAP